MATRILDTLLLVMTILSFLLSCPALANIRNAQPRKETERIPKKHDYKHTFKKPYYYNNTVPFFDTYGHTLLAPEFIRLAPSVPKHAGSIWAQLPNSHKEWEVVFTFRISGNYYLGGRGIAFWYTKDRGQEGPVFGSKDNWEGLAVIFETVDHVNKREHPYIMAHINDGSTTYSNITSPNQSALAGCYRMFRNTQSPVHARISYFNGTLRLELDANDGSNVHDICFEKLEAKLPTGYYFGISAVAEGDTPDDHDILSFETYEIDPPEKPSRPLRPHEAEKIKKMPAEKYEIPEEVKKRIEDIEKVVSKPEVESREKDDPRSLDFIRGMQIRILESLDRLHEQIHAPSGKHGDHYYGGPSKTETKLAAINQKLDMAMASISSLDTRISRISSNGGGDHAIKELKDDLHHIMSKIESLDKRITGQFYQAQRSFQDAAKLRDKDVSTSSMWLYLVSFTLLAILSIGAYVLYQTKMELDQKKFI